MNARISAPAAQSRFPVGSSAKMISGRLASARATATRCCWPPDSSFGRCFKRSARPTVVDDVVEPSLVGLAAGELHRQRDVLDRGQRRHQVERLEDEAEPVRRSTVSCFSLRVRSTSPIVTVPPSRRSRPAMQCMSVDLPEPEGPMMAVNWPAAKSMSTPSRAHLRVARAVDLGRAASRCRCDGAVVEVRSGGVSWSIAFREALVRSRR